VVEEEELGAVPEAFALSQNYPNPFNSGTVIRFALPKADDVELAIYNLAGQRVMNLAQGPRNAGSYTLRWDGRDDAGRELASGMYLFRLQAGKQLVESRKMLLIR
jgi:flagellar hook assembly protein FlgD